MAASDFRIWVKEAAQGDKSFHARSREDCVAVAKEFAQEERARIQKKHQAGESGANVIRMLSDLADELVIGIFTFAMANIPRPGKFASKIALCAHGGYGNQQLNPYSDLDLGLVYEGRVGRQIKALSDYLTPFFWDLGYENSFVVRTVKEAVELSQSEFKVYTSYLSVRCLTGNTDLFGKMKLALKPLRPEAFLDRLVENAKASITGSPINPDRDLFAPQPNIKDGAGGLRDFHAGLWLYRIFLGVDTLDEIAGQGYITPDERLELASALDHMWRIRNALHFTAGKQEDRLSFDREAELAVALGYTDEATHDTARFMQDYYSAARVLNAFYLKACQLHLKTEVPESALGKDSDESGFEVVDGALQGAFIDDHWFEENPARLMAVFHEVAKRDVALSLRLTTRVSENVHLIGDSFRESALVRRFFVSVCNRPVVAGRTMRLMAETGVLERYLPEFKAVRDIIRYEDFHHYPVDEHTLRAIEALATIPSLSGPVGSMLLETFERIQDPHILVLALLCHDLGKATGEEHSEEGRRMAWELGNRIGLPDEDTERIAFLVQHHLLMTHIALYRDTDDVDVIETFAKTIKSDNRLRYLLLLSYCDMSAVGPNVWNDWKGSLLLKLFFRTERVLIGHSGPSDEAYWEHPKAQAIADELGEESSELVQTHLKDLGVQYFSGFSVSEIVMHLNCLKIAREKGFAVASIEGATHGTTEFVVCTPDHPGLFEEIAGCFASELIDIERSTLFTCGDGIALDHFTVVTARNRAPMTANQVKKTASVLSDVIVQHESVDGYMERSQRRIFSVLHPQAPMPTRISFDNEGSHRYTIIDIIAGDRTGLLYDIAKAMNRSNMNIARAHIVTDARRVRDSFYVTRDNCKIDNPAECSAIEDALHGAIQSSDVSTG
ncbi:MAG: [protein-PII] uridylyltransferase [Candidatus Hydrogenedentota bacterium]